MIVDWAKARVSRLEKKGILRRPNPGNLSYGLQRSLRKSIIHDLHHWWCAEDGGAESGSDDDDGLRMFAGTSTMSLTALHSEAMVPEGM